MLMDLKTTGTLPFRMQMTQEKLTSTDVARKLGVTPQAVRLWARLGVLPVAERTVGGIRLFDADAVEQLATERKAAARAKKGGGKAAR